MNTPARLVLLTCLLGSLPAFAQSPPDEEAPPDQATASADRCEPAGSGASEADGVQRDGPDRESEPCPAEADELAEIEVEADMRSIVEEDPSVKASADEVFQPGEEISEDYPVPLPSDI